jgi:hypothetical protein
MCFRAEHRAASVSMIYERPMPLVMSRLHGVEGANSYRTKKQELWQLLAGASQQRPQAEDLISPAQGTDNYTPEAKGLANTVRPNK